MNQLVRINITFVQLAHIGCRLKLIRVTRCRINLLFILSLSPAAPPLKRCGGESCEILPHFRLNNMQHISMQTLSSPPTSNINKSCYLASAIKIKVDKNCVVLRWEEPSCWCLTRHHVHLMVRVRVLLSNKIKWKLMALTDWN